MRHIVRTTFITGLWSVLVFTIVELIRPGTVTYFFPLAWLWIGTVAIGVIDLVKYRGEKIDT
ncbi:MAG: hypothetical protein HW383_586 [Candidatus Magasanikbacteria bacterium]|nr:hypothetical protein [Candidatus Magasanikbacteria bacterium]